MKGEMMTEQSGSTLTESFKDRRGWLTFFGVLEILIGVALFAIFFFSAIGILLSRSVAASEHSQFYTPGMLIGMLIYPILGAAFIWLGIGSLGYKRWARALILIISWFWFVTGIIAMIFMILFLPKSMKDAVDDPALLAIISVVSIGFVAIFLLVIPGIFILFFKSKHVKLTVEKYDTKTRWTDKAPLPVIALSIILVYFAFSPLFAAPYGWIILLFGAIIDGVLGLFFHLLSAAIAIYLAVQIYRLDYKAFWYAVAFYGFWFISSIITILSKDIFEIYSHMMVTEEQMLFFARQGILSKSNLVLLMGFGFCVMAVYLMYVRKYFKPEHEISDASANIG